MGLDTKLETNIMSTKSTRFRILLWYSITLCLATALIFLSFYLVTQQIIFQQVDKELATHAGKLSGFVTRQGIDIHETVIKEELSGEFNDIPGMVIVILDQNGNVLRSSLNENNPRSVYQYLFQQTQNNLEPVFLNQNIGSTPMRFVAESIKKGNDFLGVVLVAHPIDAIQKSLNILLSTLGVVFILLIFPSILGGRILANNIMRPISKISDKMEKINSEKLEERVENLQTGDEIENLGVTFNNLLDRLQESFKRERQFIGDVAHELKTPVATLKIGIEVALSKDRSNNEYKETLRDTLLDVDRLSTTINNILDLAWLGAENANSGEKPFNLSNTLKELMKIADKLATPKRIKLNKEIEPDIIVTGVEDKIARAILNVVDNAIKYTPNGKSIIISLKGTEDTALIEVKDPGIGISEEELEHIFDRFYRGGKTAKTLGSGLGLAIARGIIKAHQGEIKVSSEVGKGTSVTVSLLKNIS